MGKKFKIQSQLRLYLQWPILLSVFVMAANLVAGALSPRAGLAMSGFTLLYIMIAMWLFLYRRKKLLNGMVEFSAQYAWVQKQLLDNMAMPYAVTDETGRLLWLNQAFSDIVREEKESRRSLTALFPEITREFLDEMEDAASVHSSFEDKFYRVDIRRIYVDEEEGLRMGMSEGEGGDLLMGVYLFDETEELFYKQEIDRQKLVAGLIYLDNYDEALESVEEVRRSLLIALIDRKVNKYIAALDGICKKLEKDKYLVIMRKEAATHLQESRFDILEDVKTVNIGNEMAVTISIGMGLNGLSYAQNYEFARNAIDIALGRGGDQAVVKVPENVIYYGGKSQQMEKSTRVKARVKAHALREIISVKDEVYVMGHRIGDVDSFGASVGIYRIAEALDKKAHIVLNDVTASMQPMVDMFRHNEDYADDMIITNQQALEMVGNNAVLVVVDVNKPSITECPELLKRCKSIVVLDHHRQGTESIENATLSYIEAYASSSCEMVSEILQYISDDLRLRAEEAACMYSGIMIDTNNFMTKTGVRTFEAAAFLRRNGADVTRVRKLFRDDAAEYKAKADAVSQAEIYRHYYAISVCTAEDVASPTIVGAQAANELLNIKGIKASFILTRYNGIIYISARSIDEVNVQVIMERMGGGGHLNMAGAQIENGTMEEGIESIKRTLDTMIEEGELD